MSKIFRILAVLLFVAVAAAAMFTPKPKMVFADGGEWAPLCPPGTNCPYSPNVN